ncbi:MAG: cytochrome c biosis protein CcsA [Bacteroidota bacterium]|jgi:heme exporter protein C
MREKRFEIAGLAWWKWLCMILLSYTVWEGFFIEVPRLPILHETIRNLFFHVTMWFGMIILMIASIFFGIRFLRQNDHKDDVRASSCIHTGMLFGIIGLVTGSLWARFTWGAWWVNDAKLNGAAASMLVYFAYLVLRGSVDDEQKRARIAAVYSIFSFTLMLVFIMILPRLTDSLHPGNGGNPAFSQYDLDSRMRTVFYPAVIGWTLLGAWITEIDIRRRILHLNMANSR